NTSMLIASAIGGVSFGLIADRFGRVRTLSLSIATYAFFTLICGFAQTALQLAVFRACMGFGMGGEWGTGATLVAETWPAQHGGTAMGLVQSSWAIGYGLAALATAVLLPRVGWRGVFFFGAAPALAVLWIRKYVQEPHRAEPRIGSIS